MAELTDEARAWLNLCPNCDAGIPTSCACPPGDPRAMILRLVTEVERLRGELAVARDSTLAWMGPPTPQTTAPTGGTRDGSPAVGPSVPERPVGAVPHLADDGQTHSFGDSCPGGHLEAGDG